MNKKSTTYILKQKSKILGFSLLFTFFLLICMSVASAKSYTVDKADIHVVVNDDASLDVQESISYTFDGPFTFAYRDIKLDYQQISDVKVTDSSGNPLVFEQTDTGYNTKRIKWYYTADSESKTFIFSYKLSNALNVYKDVTEFNWKIWGDGWDHPLKELDSEFILPQEANPKDVYTWGHPDINGKIAMLADNRTVILQAFNIPAYQWVELRVVFNSSMLPLRQNIAFEDGLQKILNEEAGYKTNGYPQTSGVSTPLYGSTDNSLVGVVLAFLVGGILNGLIYVVVFVFIILQFFRKTRNIVSQVFKWVIYGFFFAVFIMYIVPWLGGSGSNVITFFVPLIIIIVIFLSLYIVFGREPKIVDNAIYEREIPYDYPPAIVSALINQNTKKPGPRDYLATILHLCLLKKLKFDVVKKKKILGIFGKDTDYNIMVKDPSTTGLREHEAMVLDYIVHVAKSDGEQKNKELSVLFSKFESSVSDPINGFQQEFREWQDKVKEEAIAEGFFDNSNAYFWFYLICGAAVVLAFISQNPSWAVAGIIGAVMNTIFNQALPKRTPHGAEHYLKWKHLKHYLNDFTAMKNNPPQAIILWEKFLVYAVTLGVADKVEDAMKIILPDKNMNSTIFVGSVNYHTLAMSSAFSDMSFSPAFAGASGTGGGGGFGGGGCGGGGGGGGGAG